MRRRALALPLGVALAGAAAVAVGARELPAGGEAVERIAPGREAAVTRMVRDAAPSPAVSSIEIDRDLVRLHRAADGVVVVVRRREPAGLPAGETSLGRGVALRCPTACPPGELARAGAFAGRLARSREARAAEVWGAAAPTHRARRLAWRALLVALAAATAAQWQRARPFGDRRLRAGALAVLAAGALTLLLAHVPLLPAHDHDTFIARADCAVDPACERSPRGAWGMPSLALYGMFLDLLPYRLLTLSAVSLAFAALNAALLCALVAGLAARSPLADRAALTGALAGLFLVTHPAFARVAAADTPWPFAAACLLLAALSALHASEPDAPPWEPWVALGWAALALTSNYALLGLAPAAALAPWCLARGPLRPRAATLAAVAAWAVVAGPAVREALRAVALVAPARHAAPTLALALRSVVYFDGRLTPPTWALLAVAGVAAVALRRLRVFAFLVAGAVAVQLTLGVQVPLETGYPTFFAHTFLSHFFFAAFAAVGASAALGWARARRPVALALLAALALLPWPLCRETLAFARAQSPLAREARALSAAFERLPPHDVLVVPPDVARDLADEPAREHPTHEPVEYAFPRGELAAVFRRRGLSPPRVVPSDRFLREGVAPGERTLLYVGSVSRTFLRGEIDEGLVPGSLERPELAAVRARYDLAPVLTFDLPTAQGPFAGMRVLADRAARVTLGFYRLTPTAETRLNQGPQASTTPHAPAPPDPPVRAARARAGDRL